jgi:hypothetical protein
MRSARRQSRAAAVPQLYEALRTGKFEAQEDPVPTIVAAKFNEVQKCLNLTGHVYSAAMVVVAGSARGHQRGAACRTARCRQGRRRGIARYRHAR